jgi:hypothetical protein
MGQNSRLYTGAQYLRNNQRAKGTAFFGSDTFLPGSVYYNGALYRNIPLLYDLVSDEVIINDYANSNTLQLVKEKVRYFSVGGHYFVFIIPERSFTSFMKTGFYELLYNGSVGLFAKHEKKLVFPYGSEDQPQYVRSDFYYLKLNNVFYEVATKRSLLDLLQDKKDQLKKYIRDNRLSFNRRFEEALLKTTQYYAQLKN